MRSILALLCLASVAQAQPIFENVAKKHGLQGIKGQFVVWGDYDGDGFPDLLVNGRHLLRNGGAPGFRFAMAAQAARLPDKLGGEGMFVDFDGDGHLDIATVTSQLWRNDGKGRFTDVAEQTGYAPPPHTCSMAWFDMDGDGDLDVYFATRETRVKGKRVHSPHKLLRNEDGKSFENASKGQPFETRRRYGRAVVACDHDLDGDMDLYVGNYRIAANSFLQNDGTGKFTEIALANGTAGEPHYLGKKPGRQGPYYGHTIGAAWADFDGDGLFDLFVANLAHKWVGPVGQPKRDIRGLVCDDSRIYFNRGGPDYHFADRREAWGIPFLPVGGRGVFKQEELWSGIVCADYDNDGRTDAYVPQIYDIREGYSMLLRNTDGKRFTDLTAKSRVRVYNTYGAAWADFDGDGWVDLATMGQDKLSGTRKQPAPQGLLHLFRNKGGKASWIRFDLRSKRDRNRYCVGAQVFVTAGALRTVQQVSVGTSSHGQQNMRRLHFGLGNAALKSVFVRWGNGLVQRVDRKKLKANATNILRAPPRPRWRIATGLTAAQTTKPLRVRLRVAPTVPRGKRYLWDVDGDSKIDQETTVAELFHTYAKAGKYRARVCVLSAKTKVGLESSTTVQVK